MRKRPGIRNILMKHHPLGTPSGSPASVANYLHTSAGKVFDSTNTEFQMRGVQWVGFNKAGLAYSYTPPYVEGSIGLSNPVTGHGDAWMLNTEYKMNTVRLGISWHMVERNAPTLISPGVYKHDWTDNLGVIDPTWDTPPDATTHLGYLAALDQAILDCRGQGLRVILELQQSQWSPGCDSTQGAGMPAWLYATQTGPNPTFTVGVSVAVPANTTSTFNLEGNAAATLANWPSSGALKVTDGVTVYNLTYGSIANDGTSGHVKFHGCKNTTTTGGTLSTSATGVLVPDEVGAAKWEFFQAAGGWARSGIVGPPQDLCADFWKLLITRYKTNDTVVGIDFMNEPGWPVNHPAPLSSSKTANPSAPTDVTLVAFYDKMFTMARAIQPLLLLIYENGTYANSVSARSPLTVASTPPSGTNCVMSWHYYPTNPNNAGGPAAGGAICAMSDITTFKGYLDAQRSLARTTFGHAFWVGETSLFAHIENNIKNAEFDYTDTVFDPTNTTYPAAQLLWERLFQDFTADSVTNHYGYSIWAFQRGAGRSILNTDGTPKTDILQAVGAVAYPPYTSALGPATVVSFAVHGSNKWSDSDSDWDSPRWKAVWYDQAPFGRSTSAFSGTTLATTDVVVTSDGTLTGTTCTGATMGTGIVKTGSDSAVVLTLNLKCNSFTVNGPTTPSQLLITGLLQTVNKNGDITSNVTAFNNSFNEADPGGYLNLSQCAVALQDFYQYCPSGKDPGIRLTTTVAKDATTPYFNGFLCEGVTRDWCKPGQGALDIWFRHGTVAAHPYAYVITDPVAHGGGVTLQNQASPPTWLIGTTYNLGDCVKDPSSSTHKFYSRTNGNVGNTLPTGLGDANTNWQFYGDLHSDGIQHFRTVNTQSRAITENVYFHQMNHACLYQEDANKVGNPTDTGTWSALTNYTTAGPDLVRDSAGQQWTALLASGPGGAGAKNPLAGANPTYWQAASAHNCYAQYCLMVANGECIANGSEDPTNGAKDCLIARVTGNANPVQGTKGNNNADGSNTTWVAGQTRGIVNKRNVWASNSAPAAGDANTIIPGSASS